MEGTKPFIVLTGFGKTHVRGNYINEIDPISNLLKNLWGNTSFFACHFATYEDSFCPDMQKLFTFNQQILSRRLAPIKPALPWWPFKVPPAKNVEMQMKDALPGPASRICHNPIPTLGNSARSGHFDTHHHQLA